MDLNQSRICKGLKSLRLKHEYTQEYLADVLGKGDYSAYYRIEAGKTELKFEDAVKLAKLYKIPMEQIWDPTIKDDDKLIVNDPRGIYGRPSQLHLNIMLDGSEETLKKQIELITLVNKVLQKHP